MSEKLESCPICGKALREFAVKKLTKAQMRAIAKCHLIQEMPEAREGVGVWQLFDVGEQSTGGIYRDDRILAG